MLQIFGKISQTAQILWAKKSLKEGSLLWLPLAVHLADSAFIAQKLWNCWLSDGVKRAIAGGIKEEDCAEQLFVFLAAAHDLGKATPVFQATQTRPPCRELDEQIEELLTKAGLPMKSRRDFVNANKTPHTLATQILLEHAGCSRNVASILGAHHGKPLDNETLISRDIGSYDFNYHLGKKGKETWISVQQEMINLALDLAGFSHINEIPIPHMAAQVLLSGLLVMADWIASNEEYFPYIRPEDAPDCFNMEDRTRTAWRNLSLPDPWEAGNAWMSTDLYRERFDYKQNALQVAVLKTASDISEPGILVLEAPMGMGKTEAALVCAEVFADKAKRGGVFFALPTQATSDGIFPRLWKWANNLESGEYSVKLAHGKAQFNEDYQALKFFEGSTNVGGDEESSLFVHEWFEGQKRSLLADFVVGTIDQLLLAALKQKHVMLRHLGLAGKVVIIDECHAYDAYMGWYLDRVLNWLGAYQVPVIVLSATLPVQKRQRVIEAYQNKNFTKKAQNDPLGKRLNLPEHSPEWIESRDYPLITYTDNSEVKQEAVQTESVSQKIHLNFLREEELAEKLDDLLSDGGCAGVLVNTVRRAQELAQVLRKHFGEDTVRLLHSRFLAPDRAENERKLLRELGKPDKVRKRPEKRIVVGTQVLEQSLDIDFDVLITDISPMDLLLQRIGRLHRHRRSRPEKLKNAFCLIMGCDEDGFEKGTETIYGDYLLMRTKALLPERILLPQDIPVLVQDTYDDSSDLFPEPPGYCQAKTKHNELIKDKEKRAGDFRIAPFWLDSMQNLVGWMNTDVSDHQGEAAVRDTDESMEVLLVQEKKDGRICFLPWIENSCEIPLDEMPGEKLAKNLARQRIRLPRSLCGPWIIDKTIAALEHVNNERFSAWQESPWLKGELFLVLNENCSASLCGYLLNYNMEDGLLYIKEDETDA